MSARSVVIGIPVIGLTMIGLGLWFGLHEDFFAKLVWFFGWAPLLMSLFDDFYVAMEQQREWRRERAGLIDR